MQKFDFSKRDLVAKISKVVVDRIDMMNNFVNKSIFFFGDSITNGGAYLTQLRGYFREKKQRIAIYNKGIGGAKVEILRYCLAEELSFFKPNYAVLSYGVNDLGIWLYRSGRQLTQAEEDEKEKRVKAYSENISFAVRELKERGIAPIVCSPFCVNENIFERGNIQTVGDNKEKTTLIDDSFYKKATFKNINVGLARLQEIAKKIAKDEEVIFWDLYALTLQNVNAESFTSDGIHYANRGHCLIANGILQCMGYADCVREKYDDAVIKKIDSMEQDLRAYFFIKYNLLDCKVQNVSVEQTKALLKNFYDQNGFINGLNESRLNGFFRFAENLNENIKRLNEMINTL